MSHTRSHVFSFDELEDNTASIDLIPVKKSPANPPVFKSITGKVWSERKPVRDVYNRLIDENLDPMLANIYAKRISNPDVAVRALSPLLKDLDSPYLLPDIDKGRELLLEVIEKNGIVGLVCDFDADGMNSAAVLKAALRDYFSVPGENIKLYIGQRLTEGYGLSDRLVDRILQDDVLPDVIITADCGSSDEDRIARLKEKVNIPVIVTDHHELPLSGYPKSAAACITPLRDDSEYPDNKIAGCMVAWLFMSALRGAMMKSGRLEKSAPTLRDLLDFVALATVADCVSLGDSINNRAVVNFGLTLINNDSRPCWRAFRSYIRSSGYITSETLAFQVAPRLNARGRLDDAMTGVDFLLCDDDLLATEYAALLESENNNRKEVEREMLLETVEQIGPQIKDDVYGIAIYLPEGHPGVHGIVASRVKEIHGKPTVMMSPMVGVDDHPEYGKVLSGSCRSVDGVNVRDALQYIHDKNPNILLKFGGHHGAAGLTTHLSFIEEFQRLFDEAIRIQVEGRQLYPEFITDGPLDPKDISLDVLDNIMRAGPFGQKFEFPIYEADFTIKNMRPVGNGTHLSLTLANKNYQFKAIWFGFRSSEEDPILVGEGSTYRFAFAITENEYNGITSVQLRVEDVRDKI